MSTPKLLLLDGPSMGAGSMLFKKSLISFKISKRKQGTTVLLIEQMPIKHCLSQTQVIYVLESKEEIVLSGNRSGFSIRQSNISRWLKRSSGPFVFKDKFVVG